MQIHLNGHCLESTQQPQMESLALAQMQYNYSQITNLYMNNIDIQGDATNWILDAKVGDHFILRNSQDYADFAIYEVSSSAPVSSALVMAGHFYF